MTYPIDTKANYPKSLEIPDPLINLTAPLEAIHKRLFEFQLKHYLDEFGLAESSKHHAAARLAGILVVVAALGELPHSIVFNKIQDLPIPGWESGAIWGAKYLNVVIDQNTDSLDLLKGAIHLQGGLAGERFSKCDYPTSLFCDTYIFSICTVFLAIKHNTALDTFVLRCIQKSHEILEENHEVYDVIYKLFALGNGASTSDLRRLLADVPLTEIDSLLMRTQ